MHVCVRTPHPNCPSQRLLGCALVPLGTRSAEMSRVWSRGLDLMRRKTVVFSNEPRYRRIGETHVIDSYCFRDICKLYAVRCGETSFQRRDITQNIRIR